MSDSMTVHRLSDLLDSHFSGPSPTCIERNIRGNEWGVLKTTCSTTKGWNWRAHKVLPPAFWNLTRLEVKSGDSIITKAGPRHRVGVASFIDFVPPRIIPSGKMICLRPNPERVLPAYLALALSDSRTQRYLDQRTTGMAESQVNFENNALLGAPVWLPERDEQELIFEALTGPTAAVTSLERLIAKKQAIKQGMMQQLLTGKTRLPGFDGEWAQTSMGESGLFSGAGVDKTSNTGEPPVRLLNYVDVYHEEFVYPDTPRQMVTSSTVKQRQCDIQAGDVFFTPTSESPDDIGRSAVSLQDVPGAVYSYHLVRWRPRDSWDPIFLGFAFNAEFFRSQVVALASGSGARYVISMPGFRSLKISQPPVEEQAAIGSVLRDSSIQIEILKNQLTKVRSIKQGMMQELLTGRTRLLPARKSV